MTVCSVVIPGNKPEFPPTYVCSRVFLFGIHCHEMCTARLLWQMKTIDLPQHALNVQKDRLDPICPIDSHDVASVKKKSPDSLA